jgi:hypothetical protein
MSEVLTIDTWQSRLKLQGHSVIDPEHKPPVGFTLDWQSIECVVVGIDEDEGDASYPDERRWLLVKPNVDEILRVLPCSEFQGTRWRGLVSRQPSGYWQDFMAGPGSCLLSRLARFDEVVVRPDQRSPWHTALAWDQLNHITHRLWGMEAPPEAAAFFSETTRPCAYNPRIMCTADALFPDLLAACLLFASVALVDCVLADIAGKEVYLANHHDEIVVSIPEVEARANFLRQLDLVAGPYPDETCKA